MSQDLYAMKSHSWWEFIKFLISAQERGHLTELDLAQLFPEAERDNPSKDMLDAGAHVLSFMELMGIKILSSDTTK